MKRKFLSVAVTFLVLLNGLSFAGCDAFDNPNNNNNNNNNNDESEIPQIDNTVDLIEYTPTADDDNEYLENETYYKSASIDLVTEINGNYTTGRPFTLDSDNENKRIYHNIYFYKEDFFHVLYYKKADDLGSLYAIMSDETDQEYAEIEYTPKGSPLQINIKQQGIYNLIFDIETFGIDMVKVGDIETPVYETVKSCELMVHTSDSNRTYSAMTLDTATNEYYIETEIPANASIGFYNVAHTGRYNTTVTPNISDTLVYWDSFNPEKIRVHVGGTYKIYFHAKTYVSRLELQNPDTASYYCQVEWKQGNELTAISEDTPYLFEYTFDAQGAYNDPYVEIPSFYPALGMSYRLSVIDEDGFVAYDTYLKESGTYNLTVNLKEFTLTVEKLS